MYPNIFEEGLCNIFVNRIYATTMALGGRNMRLEDLKTEVLRLNLEARAYLVRELLASLDEMGRNATQLAPMKLGYWPLHTRKGGHFTGEVVDDRLIGKGPTNVWPTGRQVGGMAPSVHRTPSGGAPVFVNEECGETIFLI